MLFYEYNLKIIMLLYLNIYLVECLYTKLFSYQDHVKVKDVKTDQSKQHENDNTKYVTSDFFHEPEKTKRDVFNKNLINNKNTQWKLQGSHTSNSYQYEEYIEDNVYIGEKQDKFKNDINSDNDYVYRFRYTKFDNIIYQTTANGNVRHFRRSVSVSKKYISENYELDQEATKCPTLEMLSNTIPISFKNNQVLTYQVTSTSQPTNYFQLKNKDAVINVVVHVYLTQRDKEVCPIDVRTTEHSYLKSPEEKITNCYSGTEEIIANTKRPVTCARKKFKNTNTNLCPGGSPSHQEYTRMWPQPAQPPNLQNCLRPTLSDLIIPSSPSDRKLTTEQNATTERPGFAIWKKLTFPHKKKKTTTQPSTTIPKQTMKDTEYYQPHSKPIKERVTLDLDIPIEIANHLQQVKTLPVVEVGGSQTEDNTYISPEEINKIFISDEQLTTIKPPSIVTKDVLDMQNTTFDVEYIIKNCKKLMSDINNYTPVRKVEKEQGKSLILIHVTEPFHYTPASNTIFENISDICTITLQSTKEVESSTSNNNIITAKTSPVEQTQIIIESSNNIVPQSTDLKEKEEIKLTTSNQLQKANTLPLVKDADEKVESVRTEENINTIAPELMPNQITNTDTHLTTKVSTTTFTKTELTTENTYDVTNESHTEKNTKYLSNTMNKSITDKKLIEGKGNSHVSIFETTQMFNYIDGLINSLKNTTNISPAANLSYHSTTLGNASTKIIENGKSESSRPSNQMETSFNYTNSGFNRYLVTNVLKELTNLGKSQQHLLNNKSFEDTSNILITSPIKGTSFNHTDIIIDTSSMLTDQIKEVKYITDLGSGNILFYLMGKWFITNQKRIWSFDSKTNQEMNETFVNMSKQTDATLFELYTNKIKPVISSNQINYTNEKMPFGLFSQSILMSTKSNYKYHSYSLEWAGLNISFNDLNAMLQLSNIDSDNVSINWENIYQILKEANKTFTADYYQYSVANQDGSYDNLTVYSNGTSIYKGRKLDVDKILLKVENLNKRSDFSEKIINSIYHDNGTISSFFRNIVDQKINFNTTYATYTFSNQNFNFEEILALLRIVITTLKVNESLQDNIDIKNWDTIFANVRSAGKQHFFDRTVYNIKLENETRPLTVFANGSTEFNNIQVTLNDLSNSLKYKTVSAKEIATKIVLHQTTNQVLSENYFSNNPAHVELSTPITNNGEIGIIDFRKGKFQFYYKNKWFITDGRRMWSFDSKTDQLMNQTFINMSKASNYTNLKSITNIIKSIVMNNEKNNFTEIMPFGLFAQSILMSAKFNYKYYNYSLQWAGLDINFIDLLAIIRLSNIDSEFVYNNVPINWENVYRILKQTYKTITNEYFQYTVANQRGSYDILTVYFNGTSIYKGIKLDVDESLLMVENLNNRSDFSENSIHSIYSYNGTISSFFKNVLDQRINSKITYTKYTWGNQSFTFEEVLGLLTMVIATLKVNQSLQDNLNVQNWETILANFRSSTQQYLFDRTIYNVRFQNETRLLTVFTNGSTEFNNIQLTLNDLSKRLNYILFVSDGPHVVTTEQVLTQPRLNIASSYATPDQLSIDQVLEHCVVTGSFYLGNDKIIFSCDGQWFATFQERIWSFDSRTSQALNQTFITMSKKTSAKYNKEYKYLIESMLMNKSLHILPEKMPFELFAQSFFKSKVLNSKSIDSLFWAGHNLSFSDLSAMLRLANVDKYRSPEYRSLFINWENVYEQIKQSEKSTLDDAYQYKVDDGLGTYDLLTVFFNGTSVYKGKQVDMIDLASLLDYLVTISYFSERIVNSVYNASGMSFPSFLFNAIDQRIDLKITYTSYTWGSQTFNFDELLAVLRLINDTSKGSFQDNLTPKNWNSILTELRSSKRLFFTDRTVYYTKYGSSIVPLTVFLNGSTEFNSLVITLNESFNSLKRLLNKDTRAYT